MLDPRRRRTPAAGTRGHAQPVAQAREPRSPRDRSPLADAAGQPVGSSCSTRICTLHAASSIGCCRASSTTSSRRRHSSSRRRACCPTHGADVDSLRRAAERRPVHRATRRPGQCVERSMNPIRKSLSAFRLTLTIVSADRFTQSRLPLSPRTAAAPHPPPQPCDDRQPLTTHREVLSLGDRQLSPADSGAPPKPKHVRIPSSRSHFAYRRRDPLRRASPRSRKPCDQ